jgi:DNA polymerase-3 subunit delta
LFSFGLAGLASGVVGNVQNGNGLEVDQILAPGELSMAAFDKKDFPKILEQIEQGHIAPIYLLHGEDYLVKSALEELTQLLVPESQRSTNLQVVDGSEADFRQILESVNTFALFGGRKVVVVRNSQIFYSRANLPGLAAKSKEAYEAGDLKTAARLLLEVLGYAAWSLADVAAGAWREIPADLWKQTMGVEQEQSEVEWLEQVLEYASTAELEIAVKTDEGSLLEKALLQGFPSEHCLLITTDTIDRRRSLYRLMEEKGMVADFSVTSGAGRKARAQQEAVLRSLAEETLSVAGKKIEPGALSLLLERTGFNLWALKTQLEKIISFVGKDSLVTLVQIEGMCDQFREEALYELNNAVTGRDCETALQVLNRLLDQNYHPLQVIASLATEVRRLLLAREFIEEHLRGSLDPSISYGRFQKTVLPIVKENTEKGSPLGSMHPFALHKALVRSGAYQTAELINVLQHLFRADLTLKSSGIAERAVMESLIIKLCQPMVSDAVTE